MKRNLLNLSTVVVSTAAVLCLVSTAAYSSSNYESKGNNKTKPVVELDTHQGSFTFNGSVQSVINLANSPILNVSGRDFSVAVWVKFNSLNNTGPICSGGGGPDCDMSLADKMNAGSSGFNGDGWRLLKQQNDRFWFCLGGGYQNGCVLGNSTTVTSSTLVTPGISYYVVGVKTSTDISIYVNGVLEGKTLLGSFTDTGSTNLLIGGNRLEGAYLDGKIDNFQLYNKALSQQEISKNYQNSNENEK